MEALAILTGFSTFAALIVLALTGLSARYRAKLWEQRMELPEEVREEAFAKALDKIREKERGGR